MTKSHTVLQPAGWPTPKGYANGIKARGEMVFVGGMVGWDEHERFPAGFAAQTRQARGVRPNWRAHFGQRAARGTPAQRRIRTERHRLGTGRSL